MLKIVPDLREIFSFAINEVRPINLMAKRVSYNKKLEKLTINKNTFNLENRTVYVVGAGKAVEEMAVVLEREMGTKIKNGVISVPHGSLYDRHTGCVLYCEGAQYNLPDVRSETTAKQISKLASTLTKKDTLLVLLSGGGSALLSLPKYPITLEEKTVLIKMLANAGADIMELNCVRKRISDVKGGQLAIKAQPAKVISLILSDIVGDRLDSIASGPTFENKDNPSDAITILKKYNLYEDLPQSIKTVLLDTTQLEFPVERVWNHVLGNNKICTTAAQEAATSLNYQSFVLSNIVTGEVRNVAKSYANLARLVCAYIEDKLELDEVKSQIKSLEIPGLKSSFIDDIDKNRSLCLILGGEPTIVVMGKGLGGRNQHLALEFSRCLDRMEFELTKFNVCLMSAGTDGMDGPTDAAGAIGFLGLVPQARKDNLDVDKYAENCNSYQFFSSLALGAYHINTGHSYTNVMDLHVMIINRRDPINYIEVHA